MLLHCIHLVFDGHLQQCEAFQQNTFPITSLPVVSLPEVEDMSSCAHYVLLVCGGQAVCMSVS